MSYVAAYYASPALGVKRAPPLKSIARTNWTPPHPRAQFLKCGSVPLFVKKIDHTGGIWEVLVRVWGKLARSDEFYPIFGHVWLFWCILCTLVHFGNNMVILVGTCKRVAAVTMAPRGLGYAHMGPYFDNWHSPGCLRGLFGVRVPTVPHLSEPGGCPQNDRVLTQMHQRARNTPK